MRPCCRAGSLARSPQGPFGSFGPAKEQEKATGFGIQIRKERVVRGIQGIPDSKIQRKRVTGSELREVVAVVIVVVVVMVQFSVQVSVGCELVMK